MAGRGVLGEPASRQDGCDAHPTNRGNQAFFCWQIGLGNGIMVFVLR